MAGYDAPLDDTTRSSDGWRDRRGGDGGSGLFGGGGGGRGRGVAEDDWDGSLGGGDDIEYVDDDGWYHPGGGGGGGGSRGYMGRGAEGSGWDWTGLGSTPEVPMNKRHKRGKSSIADRTPVTGRDALFPNKGKAEEMLRERTLAPDPFATEGSGTGDKPDLPLTAGPGKFSRQNVRNRAFMMPAVRQAMGDGRQVMLIRNITINRQRVQHVETLSRGLGDDNPMYVTFSGDFNADGSQARGKQARMENSDECDCSTGSSGSSGASGSGSGGGGGGTGGGPSGGSTGSTSGTGTSGEAADGSTPETGAEQRVGTRGRGETGPTSAKEVTDRKAVTNKKPVTENPYTWDETPGTKRKNQSIAPVAVNNPTPTYTPPSPPYTLPPQYTSPYEFTKELLPPKIDHLNYSYPIMLPEVFTIGEVDESKLLKITQMMADASGNDRAGKISNIVTLAQFLRHQNLMIEARENMEKAAKAGDKVAEEKFRREYAKWKYEYQSDVAMILIAAASSEAAIAVEATSMLKDLVEEDTQYLIDRKRQLEKQLNPFNGRLRDRDELVAELRRITDKLYRKLGIKRNNVPTKMRQGF